MTGEKFTNVTPPQLIDEKLSLDEQFQAIFHETLLARIKRDTRWKWGVKRNAYLRVGKNLARHGKHEIGIVRTLLDFALVVLTQGGALETTDERDARDYFTSNPRILGDVLDESRHRFAMSNEGVVGYNALHRKFRDRNSFDSAFEKLFQNSPNYAKFKDAADLLWKKGRPFLLDFDANFVWSQMLHAQGGVAVGEELSPEPAKPPNHEKKHVRGHSREERILELGRSTITDPDDIEFLNSLLVLGRNEPEVTRKVEAFYRSRAHNALSRMLSRRLRREKKDVKEIDGLLREERAKRPRRQYEQGTPEFAEASKFRLERGREWLQSRVGVEVFEQINRLVGNEITREDFDNYLRAKGVTFDQRVVYSVPAWEKAAVKRVEPIIKHLILEEKRNYEVTALKEGGWGQGDIDMYLRIVAKSPDIPGASLVLNQDERRHLSWARGIIKLVNEIRAEREKKKQIRK